MAGRIASERGKGTPLPPQALAAEHGPGRGAPPTSIRVHTDARADQLARATGSEAFTAGTDVFFRAGRHDQPGLLAHELRHVIRDVPSASASVIFRRPPTQTAPLAPAPPQSAADRLAGYPHLAKTLAADQVATLQKAIDARARLDQLQQEMDTKYSGSAAYLSENRPKIEALQRQMSKQGELLARSSDVYVPTEQLLSNDILPDPKAPEVDALYRQNLYRQLISYPTRVHIDPTAQAPFGRFVELRWGPNTWLMPNDGGLIRWRDLMQIQQFSMPYMLALEKRRIELEIKMLDAQRDAGDIAVGFEGKKLGERYGSLWNDSIKLHHEVGRMKGYYDDPKGRSEMYADLAKVGGSNAVVKHGEWMHIFALAPQYKSHEFTSLPGEESRILWILDKGRQVTDVILIESADGYAFARGDKGWFIRANELTTIEQFAIGAIFGDAWEDPTLASTLGQIFIGVIPIVGQIADARDVAIGVHKIWETGGKDGKLQTALALIGFVPLLGDAIKAAKGGGKKAVAKAIEEAVPAAEKTLARELTQDSARVAERFGVKEAETAAGKAMAKSLEELGAKALREGGQAMTEYANALRKTLDDLGGNAAALVSVRGGKWKEVAKDLSRIIAAGDPEAKKLAEALANDMQAWRVRAFKDLESGVAKETEEAAAALGREVEAPHMEATGTKGFSSDFDVNLMGPDASLHKSMAARRMEQQFGANWKDLLHADLFVDPTRIHMFDKLEARAARRVEKAMAKESELNVLAKMIREGADPGRVEKYAKQLGVDLKGTEFAARKAELEALAADPTARLKLELKMDALHSRFLKEADTAVKEGLAKDMAKTQSLLNASAAEAYVTPGGVAKQVTRREGMEGLKQMPYKAMSPRMGYMAVLDDLAMLEGTVAKAAKQEAAEELSVSTVKSMAKYADRLMVTAGQYGADFSKAGSARQAFEEIAEMLLAARKDPSPLVLSGKAHPAFRSAAELVKSELEALVKQVRVHAGQWTAEMAATEVKDAVTAAVKTVEQQKNTFLEVVAIVDRNLLRVIDERERSQATSKPGSAQGGPVDAGVSGGVP